MYHCGRMLKSDVRRFYGTYAAAARALGVTKAAVSAWRDVVPEGVAYKLHVLTDGALWADPAVYAHRKEQRKKHLI